MYKTKFEVEKWLDKMYIKKYSINDDLTIDVDGTVYLNSMNLSTIPFQFNIVTGSFYCSYNQLISLEGCPKIVYGNFNCARNYGLISLKHCPKLIGVYFNCDDILMNEKEYKIHLMMKSLRK